MILLSTDLITKRVHVDSGWRPSGGHMCICYSSTGKLLLCPSSQNRRQRLEGTSGGLVQLAAEAGSVSGGQFRTMPS